MNPVLARWEAWAGRHLSGRAGLFAVLTVMLVLAWPGFLTLPPVDRDEVLFAQSSRQMLATGDFVDIRFADLPRYKKPVGIYWLQAGAAALTGQPGAIWSYRLVSLAAALASVGLTWAIARRVVPGGGAVLAAVALASCLVLGGEARLAKTDATLLATILLGQWVLARLWLPDGKAGIPRQGAGVAMLFWLALAASLLVKGPIGPMVLGFTLAGLCWSRRDLALLRVLRPVWGLTLLLVLVLPWVVAISVKSQGAFWASSVGHDLMGKLAEAQESHGAPPGTYLAAVWVTFWPGSMLLLAALPGIWALRGKPFAVMALAWVVPAWIVFEATPTKLVHYVLPTYPALAILLAWALVEARMWRWAAWPLALVPAVIGTALAVLAWRSGIELPWFFWPLAALSLALGMAVPLATARGGPWSVAAALALAGLGLSGAIYPGLAAMPGLWPARQLAALAADHPGCALTVAGYAEPSLVFWTDNAATLATIDAARSRLLAPGCQLVALPAGTGTGSALAQVDGLDLGSGKPLHLSVYLKAE